MQIRSLSKCERIGAVMRIPEPDPPHLIHRQLERGAPFVVAARNTTASPFATTVTGVPKARSTATMHDMDPSIWSTSDRSTFVVTTGTDPANPSGRITNAEGGWTIVDDPQARPPFATMYEAANAIIGVSDIDYNDYLLGKGEESRTVFTTSEQMQRIVHEGRWEMISASAPRLDDVN
jgi:hypothetical protein